MVTVVITVTVVAELLVLLSLVVVGIVGVVVIGKQVIVATVVVVTMVLSISDRQQIRACSNSSNSRKNANFRNSGNSRYL